MLVTLDHRDLAEVLRHVNMQNIGNDPNSARVERISRAFAACARGAARHKREMDAHATAAKNAE